MSFSQDVDLVMGLCQDEQTLQAFKRILDWRHHLEMQRAEVLEISGWLLANHAAWDVGACVMKACELVNFVDRADEMPTTQKGLGCLSLLIEVLSMVIRDCQEAEPGLCRYFERLRAEAQLRYDSSKKTGLPEKSLPTAD